MNSDQGEHLCKYMQRQVDIVAEILCEVLTEFRRIADSFHVYDTKVVIFGLHPSFPFTGLLLRIRASTAEYTYVATC